MILSRSEITGRDPGVMAIGLDVGGTKIAAGVVSSTGEVMKQLPPIPTPADQDAILACMGEAISNLRRHHRGVSAIGVGAAGLIDWPEGHVRMAANVGLERMPLRRLIEDATGLPTIVDNDANTATWAEARLGASSAPYMLFVTVGTGIGGGIVLDGQLFRGRSGIGAEIGHMAVDPRGGEPCECGGVGCLEAVASGRALGRYGREAAAVHPEGLLARLAGGADKVTGETVHQAARDGDATALTVYGRLGEWLGLGLGTLVTLLDLELIVVGGGAAAAGEILLEPTRASLARHVLAADYRALPDVVSASLENGSGWIGAGILALDCLPGRLAARADQADRGGIEPPAAGG
jgi:glucokinase